MAAPGDATGSHTLARQVRVRVRVGGRVGVRVRVRVRIRVRARPRFKARPNPHSKQGRYVALPTEVARHSSVNQHARRGGVLTVTAATEDGIGSG